MLGFGLATRPFSLDAAYDIGSAELRVAANVTIRQANVSAEATLDLATLEADAAVGLEVGDLAMSTGAKVDLNDLADAAVVLSVGYEEVKLELGFGAVPGAWDPPIKHPFQLTRALGRRRWRRTTNLRLRDQTGLLKLSKTRSKLYRYDIYTRYQVYPVFDFLLQILHIITVFLIIGISNKWIRNNAVSRRR